MLTEVRISAHEQPTPEAILAPLSAPLLEIRGLHARFTSHLGELDALEDVTFEVRRSEFVCLVGPSGCGKSTLLRIIAGLLPVFSGEVRIEGQAVTGPNNKVGLVFQQPTLLPWRSVTDNIALPLQIRGLPEREIKAQVAHLLTLVGLADFGQEYPANLSGGMAQRAAIARALAQNPEVLLLDEPFGALDALTREHMAGELLRIWEQSQRTVLMVTHNVEEATLLADRVIVLSARPGHVVEVVDIPLPRPRSPEMLATMALQHTAQQLRDALYRGNGTGLRLSTRGEFTE